MIISPEVTALRRQETALRDGMFTSLILAWMVPPNPTVTNVQPRGFDMNPFGLFRRHCGLQQRRYSLWGCFLHGTEYNLLGGEVAVGLATGPRILRQDLPRSTLEVSPSLESEATGGCMCRIGGSLSSFSLQTR